MSNPRNFFSLDKITHNGQVEWEEWLARFYKDHDIEKDVELQRGHKEKLAAAKAAWSEAARSNPDALNLDEFLGFMHPESSHSGLAQQLEDMLTRHDLDGDGVIALKGTHYIHCDPFIMSQKEAPIKLTWELPIWFEFPTICYRAIRVLPECFLRWWYIFLNTYIFSCTFLNRTIFDLTI